MIRWAVGMVLDAVLALRESGAVSATVKLGPLVIDASFPEPAAEEEGESEHVGMGFRLDDEAEDEDDD